MKNRLIFLVIFLSFYFGTLSVYAQNQGSIRGIVKDSINSEVLPFSNIFIKELKIGLSADSRGYFVIPSLKAPGIYSLVISYVGYQTKEYNVKVEPAKITELEIHLDRYSIELSTIEKVENFSQETSKPQISRQILTPKDLENIPMNVESDLLRSLSIIPGVQNSGDVSVRFNVRGGESNQNLILLDGMSIYYPFHAIGLLGVIDPDIINNVEFFKGGFSSKYGRAVSSIVKITTNNGNTNSYSGKASTSLLSAKGMVEGPIPYGSFYFTGRKSISNKILKKFLDEKELPVDFHDYSFKVNFRNPNFFEGTKFSLINLTSEDKLTYADPATPDYSWSNNVWGIKVFTVGEIPFFLDLGISISSYKNKLIPKESSIKPKSNELLDFSFSTDFLYITESKDEIELGIDVKSYTSKLFLVNRFDYPTDVGESAIGSSAYFNYKFLRFSDLKINTGFRINIADPLAKGNFIEPRIDFSYQLSKSLLFKTAYGIYQQELTTLQDEREVLSLFDPIVIIPKYLPKAKSEHYVTGLSLNLSNNIFLDLEGYYKKIISAPTLNENKVVFSDPDLINSKGEAYGAEFSLDYNHYAVQFNIGYTLSWAFKEVNGISYHPKYDSRHNLNIGMNMNLPFNFKLSTAWKYNSGHPYTQQAGYYDILSFNEFFTDYDIFNTLTPVQLFANKNAAILPDYHRLDISLSKKIDFDFLRMNIKVSAINVYDRKNIYYFEQNTGKRVNMLPFLLTGTIEIEL